MADHVTPNNANQTESGSWYDSIAQLAADAKATVDAAGRTAGSLYDAAASAASDIYDATGETYDSLAEGASELSDWLASDDTQAIPVPPPTQTQNQYVEVVRSDAPVEPVRAAAPVAARMHDEPGMMERARNAIVGNAVAVVHYVANTELGQQIICDYAIPLIEGVKYITPDFAEKALEAEFNAALSQNAHARALWNDTPVECPPEQAAIASAQVAQAPEEPGIFDTIVGGLKSIAKAILPEPVENYIASFFDPAPEVVVVLVTPSAPVTPTQPTETAPLASPTEAARVAETNRSAQRVASSMQQGAESALPSFETPEYVPYYESEDMSQVEDAFALAEEPSPSSFTAEGSVDLTAGGTEAETAVTALASVDFEAAVEDAAEEVLETEARSTVATLTTSPSEENNSNQGGSAVVATASPAALALANGTSTLSTGTRAVSSEGKTLSIAPKPASPKEPLEDSNGSNVLASNDQSETGDDSQIPSTVKDRSERDLASEPILVTVDDERQEREELAAIPEAQPLQASLPTHGVSSTQVMDQAAARDAQIPDNPKMVAAYVGPRQAGVIADSGNDSDGGRVSHAAGEIYVAGNINVSDEDSGNSNREGRDRATEDIYAYADWLASRNTSWGKSSAATSKRQSTG